MTDRPPPLPDDLLDLLDAERELEPPPVEVRERMFARLVPFVLPISGGGGSSGPGADGIGGTDGIGGSGLAGAAGATSGAATAGSALGAKAVAIALSASLGAVGGGTITYAVVASPPPSPPAVHAPAPPRDEPEPPATEAPAELGSEPPVVTATTEAVEAKPESPSRPRPAPARPSPSDLRAERLLIETASAALVRGDHASALARLRSHVAKYPRGALAEEREVLMIRALVASGDKDAARKRAGAFRTSFPNSLQQSAVSKAIE